MATEPTREPVLAPLVQRAPRLLRAERVPVRGVRSPARAAALLLTLDLGRLWIQPGEKSGELQVALRDPREPAPEGAVSADEEEPWWALLGSPLRAAWARPDPSGGIAAIELEFRERNPKIVSLALHGGELQVSVR